MRIMEMEELKDFMRRYEAQTNTHVFDNVASLIADDATYWFSDGEHAGKENIRRAFEKTWAAIQQETYALKDLRWIAASERIAACTYVFRWKGIVNGAEKRGEGRGTSVLVKDESGWKILHEHLSTKPAVQS